MAKCVSAGALTSVLLGLVALAACGSGAGAAAATPAATGPPTASPYVDAPKACRSRLPAGTTATGALLAGDHVVAAVTCREAEGAPTTVVVRTVTGGALAAVVAALRQPSRPPRPVCDASGRVLPAFAVQLEDGRWTLPAVPSDGCHPTDAAVRALTRAAR